MIIISNAIPCSHSKEKITSLVEKGLPEQIIDYINLPDNFYDLLVLIEAHVSLGNLMSCDTLLQEWTHKTTTIETQYCWSYLHGLVHLQHHSFMQAEKIFLSLLDTVLSSNPYDLLPKIYLSLGILYRLMFAFDQSLEFLSKGISFLTQEGISNGFILAHINQQIGNTLFTKGELNNSLKYFKLSLEQFELLENNSARAGLTNNIAMVYHYKGSIYNAINHYQCALDIIKITSSNKRTLAMIYNNLGNLYQLQGNYSQSIDCHTKSLTIRKEMDNLSLIAMSYNNLGSVYHDLGLFEQALEFQNKSLELRSKLPKDLELAPTFVDKCRTLTELNVDLESSNILSEFEHLVENSSNESIFAYKSIIKALLSQQKKEYRDAIDFWNVPLQSPTLGYHYKILSHEGIIECEFQLWLEDQNSISKGKIIQSLDNWFKLCIENNLSASLCKIDILRAKLSMASLNFDEAQVTLMHCVSNANYWGLPFHKKVAEKLLTEIENKFYTIYDLVPDERETFKASQINDFMSYLKFINRFLKDQ